LIGDAGELNREPGFVVIEGGLDGDPPDDDEENDPECEGPMAALLIGEVDSTEGGVAARWEEDSGD